MRIEELDYLLLFLSSFLALFFTVFQAFLEISITIIYFIPLLILGAVLPIYIGYIRGALIYESVPERVRGWMYLILGVPFYLFSTVGRTFGLGLFKVSGISLQAIIRVNLVTMVLVTVFLLWLMFKHHKIVRRLFYIYGYKISKPEGKAILFTSLTAMLLGIFGYYIAIYASENNIFLWVAITIFIIVLCLGESASRKKLSLNLRNPDSRTVS